MDMLELTETLRTIYPFKIKRLWFNAIAPVNKTKWDLDSDFDFV